MTAGAVPINHQPSREELVDRARALGPVLSERRAEAEANRTLSAETIRDLQDADFFRILQPRRWGGLEMTPQVFYDVQIELAACCPSTAWVLGVVAVHAWQLALFHTRAQEDVWGEDPSVLVSSSYMPVGKVTHADGGYMLHGRWGFSSGSDHCDWAFLGAFVPPREAGQHPDMRTFLVPKDDYHLDDTWHVAGLKATGSKDVVIDTPVFVPEHRTHRFSDGFSCRSPGQAENDGPLYRLPFGQIFVRSVSTPAIGMTQGALNAFLDISRARVSQADGMKAAVDAPTQRVAAEAAAAVDESRVILYRGFDEMMALAERGEPIPVDRRIRFRYDASRAVDKCVAAVDQLFTFAGSRAIFLSSPIQGFFQDIHACRAHYANNPAKPGANFGAIQMDLPNTDFFL